MRSEAESLRVALLTYRGNPYSGGQGVYVRYLSKALVDLGHEVEVISGPPHPDLYEAVGRTSLPSLDLYNQADPFRTPRLDEFHDWIDVLEFASMCTASFPEPLTFSLRAARLLRSRPSKPDVVHDNQSLGYGLLSMQRSGLPVVATIHHPCSIDRDLEVAHARSRKKRASLRRWYSFTRMQGRVARRLPRILTVSESALDDVVEAFSLPRHQVAVVHNGVDTELFSPGERMPTPGRIVTTSSAAGPLKGLVHLIEAVAKVRTERLADLVVIGKPDKVVRAAIGRFGLEGAVRFESGIGWNEVVNLYREAEVAVVPSIYEGFSLPAIEAMSSGTPLVATTGGALPEVAGRDGDSALLVPPGDAGAMATAIGRLLDDPALRSRIGAAGRARVVERFTWRTAAQATVDQYREAMRRC